MKIIALANQKGGVAKTTTAIHIGVALARRGRRVLLIDLDPQGHISDGMGFILPHDGIDISDVLEGKSLLKDIIHNTSEQNLFIAPSTLRLSDMELTLVNMPFREYKLQKAIESANTNCDYILIDCPPNLGMLTINALMAATDVLIPMSSEYYSMLGVASLIKTVKMIQQANTKLSIMGIVHTRVKHTLHAKEVIDRTIKELKDIKVFNHPVYESTKFMEASGQGKTVFDTAPDIKGAQAYLAIAKEIELL